MGCRSNTKPFLQDAWRMVNSTQEMIFINDSVMHWVLFDDGIVPDTIFTHYKTDETRSPYYIDLYAFDRGILKGRILTGIYSKIGNDSLLMDFRPIDSWNEADSVRPKVFDELQKRYFVRKHP